MTKYAWGAPRTLAMAAPDDKPKHPQVRSEARPEEVTLNSPGFAATAPIVDSAPVADESTTLRLDDGEVVAGRYRLVRYLARGGMGEVYEAEDLELGERLALKTIRAETTDEIAEDRFKREIQLSRKVTHANVCRIFDVGYHVQRDGERVVFLTMELLAGETLLEQIRREGPVPLADAARIVRQVVAALTAAHNVGVVHRDLKSNNVILVPKKGGGTRAVVTDFGLAHVLIGGEDRSMSLSGSGGIVGTPGYMAPEQVEGGPITTRTDVYALGIVMFEMVTGRLPFEGATPLSVAAKRLTSPAPSPKKVRPDLPPRWEKAIMACLEREPSARPPTARSVLELLDEDFASTSIRFPRLKKRALALRPWAALVLVALTAAICLRMWRGRPQALADEMRTRGVALGSFEAAAAGQLASYGVLVRNAVRTDLAFDVPLIDAHSDLELGDGRAISIGYVRPRIGGREPLRVEGRYTVSGDGADRHIEITLRLVDPQSNEQRAAVVEAGALRKVGDVVLHAGARLRAIAGIEPSQRTTLSAAGHAAFDASMDALRDGDLARALEIVEAADASEPNAVELRFLTSRILAGLELEVSSHVAIEHATALAPSDDPYWGLRIEALRLRGDAVRSLARLEQLHARFPTDTDLSLDLSLVYLQAQRGADALRTLDALETQSLAPRERLRTAIARMIVAERMAHLTDIGREYKASQARARELNLPGLEAAVLRVACSVTTSERATAESDSVCGELRTLAERMRLPAGVVLADISWAAVRAPLTTNAQVLERAKRARSLAAQLGGRRRLTDAINVFAMVAHDANDEEADEELFVEALAIARDAHDHVNAISVLDNLAYYAGEEGHQAEEARYARLAVETARDSGSKELLAGAECRLGLAQQTLGDLAGARRIMEDVAVLLGAGGQSLRDTDCGALQAQLADAEGRYEDAIAISERYAAVEAKQGVDPASRVGYTQAICAERIAMRAWKDVLVCANQLVSATGHSTDQRGADLRLALIYRATAQAALGNLADARAVPAFVREYDDSETKADRTRQNLLLVRLDRYLGGDRGELRARIDAVIAEANTMQHRELDLIARLERLELLARDHDPTTAAEAKDLIERATALGFVGIAKRAGIVAKGGR